MTQLNVNTKVGDWVAQHPRTSRVFERLQIDYCCGGGTSVEQACWDRMLNPQEVLAGLQQAIEADGGVSNQNWATAPLADLCDHIERTHHGYLHSELPRLTEMVSKVISAHGASHPELPELGRVFAELREELEPHMLKEEHVLFPAIRRIEQTAAGVDFPFGTVANPIRAMEKEHDHAGNALAQIRELTRSFAVPDDACHTYRAMLDALRELETDLHQHIHKENNILFPRAIELERLRS
jgi:regulator of cell morphogenesis and NO signaling